MSVIAIVVARGGSRRVPRKALREIKPGVTLIAWAVERLMLAKFVDRVVVGSDCGDILDSARTAGAETRLRDDAHCDEDRCSANEMIADMVAKVDAPADAIMLWAHPTNPLIEPYTYDRAIETFRLRERTGSDSLISVRRICRHAWTAEGKPANYNPWAPRHQLASELVPTFYQDGAIFLQRFSAAAVNGYFFGRAPALFEVDEYESLDVDTERDLLVAQQLVGRLPLQIGGEQ